MRIIAKFIVSCIDKINSLFEPYEMRNVDSSGSESDIMYAFASEDIKRFMTSSGIFHDQLPDDLGDGLFYNALYHCWRIWDKHTSPERYDEALLSMERYFMQYGRLVRGMCELGDVQEVAHKKYYSGRYVADGEIGPGPLILWCYALSQISRSEAHANRVRLLARKCYDQLVGDGYWLLNPDGTKSGYGDLRPKLIQAPIQILALMLLTKLAGDDDYHKLYDKNAWRIEFADVHFPFWHPWYSEMIAFLAYDALLYNESSPYKRKSYLRGLKRMHNITKTQCNGLFYQIYSKHFGYSQQADNVIWWCLRGFNKNTKNRKYTSNVDRTDIEIVKFGKVYTAVEALPISERPSRNFEWNKNPYQLSGTTKCDYSFLDYLILYSYPVKRTW